MPPPRLLVELSLTVTLVRVSVPELRMPPPSSMVSPLEIVTPEMFMVPLLMLKTRLALFPLMDRLPDPGPWMVRFLLMVNSPLDRVIVPVTHQAPVADAATGA